MRTAITSNEIRILKKAWESLSSSLVPLSLSKLLWRIKETLIESHRQILFCATLSCPLLSKVSRPGAIALRVKSHSAHSTHILAEKNPTSRSNIKIFHLLMSRDFCLHGSSNTVTNDIQSYRVRASLRNPLCPGCENRQYPALTAFRSLELCISKDLHPKIIKESPLSR